MMANEPQPKEESTDDLPSPAQAQESDVQWEALSDESTMGVDYDDAPEEAAAAADEPPAPAQEVTPEAPAAEEAPAPAEATEGTEAAELTTDPVVPEQQLTPEQQAELYRQWQANQAAQVEQLEAYYALNEEDAMAMATEPEKVIPKLAARLHMEVMQSVQAQIAQQIPQMMETVQVTKEKDSKAKDAFFGRWPELKGHEQQVLQAGLMFRQLNPKATPQQAIEGIGKIVAASLGIESAAPPTPQTRPSAPAAPFRPASGVGAGTVRTQAKGVWADLAEDDY